MDHIAPQMPNTFGLGKSTYHAYDGAMRRAQMPFVESPLSSSFQFAEMQDSEPCVPTSLFNRNAGKGDGWREGSCAGGARSRRVEAIAFSVGRIISYHRLVM